MEKYIDLHTHSIYSDGEFSPDALVSMAKERNIGVLSITDHNRIDAYKNVDYSKLGDLKLITGVELSAKIDKGQMHILGYGIDVKNTLLLEKLSELKQVCIDTVKAIINQIYIDYGICFSDSDIQCLLNSNHNIGRPDVAKLCIKYGYANSVGDAFDRYLTEAHKKIKAYRKNLSYKECIDLILKSGGIPVLAHPKTLLLEDKELLILIRELVNFGIKGIEVYHSSHNKEEINKYLCIANSLNLFISGGSDYHGPFVKPDIELGTGNCNNLSIRKLSILNSL